MGTSITPLEPCIMMERSNLSCSLKRKRPPKIQIPLVLKEIEVDNGGQCKFGAFSPAKTGAISGSEDCGDGFGVFSVKGSKKFMEDSYKIVSSIDGNPKKSFFGVYDGHGGRQAAEFVAENLHKNLIEMVDNCEGSMAKEDAVKAAYLQTDCDFLKQDVGSGSCCVTVLIDETEMLVSNLGDCRAVLCRGGKAEALTKDHRAEREDERKRIEDNGGYVEIHRGAWRVHGILSVSRSIGDAHLKDWVVSEPNTNILDWTPDMDFLVLASDGLWDVVGNQEAIDIVLKSSVIEKKVDLQSNDLDDKRQRSLEENDDGLTCVSTSSSPKMKRVSLIKQKQMTTLSPHFRKKKNTGILREGVSEFDSDNESPPSKLRRTALFSHKNAKCQSLDQENKRPSCGNFLAACKELVKLAVTRGSLDDITVMIIGLKHFRQAKTQNLTCIEF